MPKLKDITNQRFGRLLVVSICNERSSWGEVIWLCKCDCGETKKILGSSLLSGKTKSCGCLRSDATISRNTKHGCAKANRATTEYMSWAAMKKRCYWRADKAYKNYGGRGITVCDRWSLFENFYDDMGEKPTKFHQIDRKDNNGNYCKKNCRWVTRKINNQNSRASKIWVIYGASYPSLTDAAISMNVSRQTISNWCNGGKNNCYCKDKYPS